MRRVVFTATVALVCALSACGLDVVGTPASPAIVDTPEAGLVDALPPEQPVVDGADACTENTCGLAPPAGWSIVTLTDAATPCPAGFTARNVLEDPVVPAAACTCSCQVKTSPLCTSSTVIVTAYDKDNTPMCNSVTSSLPAIPDGTCKGSNLDPGNHELFPSPPPIGAAACSAKNVIPHKEAVTTSAARVCVPPSCADACSSNPALTTCLLSPGNVACPTSGLVKHVIGSSADLTCPACTCKADSAAKCTGNWTLYNDTNCNSLQNTVPADVCTATSTTKVKSYRWNPDPVQASCSPVPTAGTATLAGVVTLCCK